MKKISGIYKIINKVNNKYYVGSSRNIKNRWNTHKQSLKNQSHHNEYLQRAWNKYGENAFDFLIEKEVLEDKLFEVEQEYLNEAKINSNSYNLIFYPQGGPQPEYIRCKMRKNHYLKNGKKSSMYGKHHTEKSKELIRQKALGRIAPNKDCKIYDFIYFKTGERFSGTKEDFSKKVGVCIPFVSAFIRGQYHSSKGWRLYPLDDYIRQSYKWSDEAKNRVNLLRKKDPITKQFLPN
jgi:group I intron endonuclease